jgi:hypothetical protein
MAKTIPQLTDATTVNAADELIIQQGGITKRATASELFNSSTIVTATGSSVARSLPDRFADALNVKDFGAVGNGVTDDAAAINASIAAAGARASIYFPAGTYFIKSPIVVHRSNIALFGDGIGVSAILMGQQAGGASYAAIDIRTDALGAGIENVTVSSLTIDGNKTVATSPENSGMVILVTSPHIIADVKLLSIRITNCQHNGVLMSGFQNGQNDQYRVERTLIQGSTFDNNGGVGIGQWKASNSTISGCTLFNNGDENLTIDVYSQACVVDGNRFFRHFSGTGNIGIDTGDGCIISNNFIDNQSDTTAVSGFRNGISLNSQLTGGGGNNEVVISGNVIRNCIDSGVIAHDDTGGNFGSGGGFIFGGDYSGDAVIVGNVFHNNGTDVRIEPGAGPTSIKANKIQTISITETQGNDVRFGAGEIAWRATRTADETIALTSGDTGWKKVSLTSLDARLTTLSSGEIILPTGGLYQLNGRIRVTGLTARSASYVSIGILHTVTGLSPQEVAIQNIETPSNIVELNVGGAFVLDRGTLGIYLRSSVASSGNVTVNWGATTQFTGAVLG